MSLSLRFCVILLTLAPILGLAQPSELDCLTTNVFFEARGESLQGMRAVADTTLNRTKHVAFKGQNTICKVVFAPQQFSWVKSQSKKRIQKLLNGDFSGLKDKDVAAYHLSKEVSLQALNNEPKSKLPIWVVSFHATSINPPWASRMKRYGKIGQLVFYGFRRKGN